MSNIKAYGVGGSSIISLFPAPIVAERDPNNRDRGDIGQVFVNTVDQDAYVLVAYENGNPVWENISGGAGTFQDLTVQDEFTVENGPTNIESTTNVAGGITLTSTGGAAETIVITNTTGTTSGSIDVQSAVGGIQFGSGRASASAIAIAATNAAGGITMVGGSGGITIGDSDTTPIDIGNITPTANRTITAGGGNIAAAITDTINVGTGNISANAGASKTVNIASGTNAVGSITTNIGSGNVASGTHAVNISTGTGTKSVTIGNADGLTSLVLYALKPATGGIGVDTVVANSTFGRARYTGFNTASDATQVLNITNTLITATSVILCTASSNSTTGTAVIQDIVPGAGTVAITIINIGAAAFNLADVITLSFMVLN